jgi:sulfite reductase (NADPH) flavoprotein alpha-component
MANYKPRELKAEQNLIIISSTHGEGDPPTSAMAFFEFIESRKAPRLEGLNYAVLALGDSTYEFFCEAGKRLDRRLEQLGGTRLAERVDCDVDYDEPAENWSKSLLNTLVQSHKQDAPVTNAGPSIEAIRTASAFDKRNPFSAGVIDNVVLTGRGSTKETRHVELSLDGSGLTFEPGDALGIAPNNDPVLVHELLELLSLSGDADVTVKGQEVPLGQALGSSFEITSASPRFLQQWGGFAGASLLKALAGESQAAERASFLRDNHIIDIIRKFSAPGIDVQSFVAGLRPLQPRLYSIASSLSLVPDEAHLTVSTVHYTLHSRPRFGVASGHLANRAEPEAMLPVYIQPNAHFRLPADDVPIVMIGAGTGVAPYRAFLQEREARGAGGRSWLFFGERNFHTDFLYQTEWQQFLKDEVLTRMNIAFSRDGSSKVYVQHRMREQARDLYAWLEEGAHIYICGDGARLAPDVDAALISIVQQERGCSPTAAGEYLAGLRQAHRYQTDVY